MSYEHRFDLAQLDAEAAYLHLLVHAAEELDLPVGQMTREIASAVESRARLVTEWVGNKLLGSQVGAVQVTARETVAADVQLSRDVSGRRTHARVEQVNARVRDGTADGNGACRVRLRCRFVSTAADDGFSWTILVDQACRWSVLTPEGELFGQQCFAADDQGRYRIRRRPARQELVQYFEMRWRQLCEAEVAELQCVLQSFDAFVFGNEQHGAACEQR